MDYLNKEERAFAFDVLEHYKKKGLDASNWTSQVAHDVIEGKNHKIHVSRGQKIIQDLIVLKILREDDYGVVINPAGEELIQKRTSFLNKFQTLYFVSKQTLLEAKFIASSVTFIAGVSFDSILEFLNKLIASFG